MVLPAADTPTTRPAARRPRPSQTRPPIAWDDPRPTVNIQQACQKASISRRTLYNWWQAGKLDWRRTASGTLRVVEETLWQARQGSRVEQAGDSGVHQ